MQEAQALALTAKYLLGTIDLQEEHLLRHWVDADPAHGEMFEACFAAWEGLQASALGYTPDTEAAWQYVQAQVAPADVATAAAVPVSDRSRRRWARLGGIGLLIGVIGIGVFFLREKPPTHTLQWTATQWQSADASRWKLSGDTLLYANRLRIWAQSDAAALQIRGEWPALELRCAEGTLVLATEGERFRLTPGLTATHEDGIWTKTYD